MPRLPLDLLIDIFDIYEGLDGVCNRDLAKLSATSSECKSNVFKCRSLWYRELFYNLLLPKLYKRLEVGTLDSQRDECLLRTLQANPRFGTFARGIKWDYEIEMECSGEAWQRRYHYSVEDVERRCTIALAILAFCPHTTSMNLVIKVYSEDGRGSSGMLLSWRLPSFRLPTCQEIRSLPGYSSLESISFTPDPTHIHTTDLWLLVDTFLKAQNLVQASFPAKMRFPSTLSDTYQLPRLHIGHPNGYSDTTNFQAIFQACTSLSNFSFDFGDGFYSSWYRLLDDLGESPSAKSITQLQVTSVLSFRHSNAFAAEFPALESFVLQMHENVKSDRESAEDFYRGISQLFSVDQACTALSHLESSCSLYYEDIFSQHSVSDLFSRFCSQQLYPALRTLTFHCCLGALRVDRLQSTKIRNTGQQKGEHSAAIEAFVAGYEGLIQEAPAVLEIVFSFAKGETGVKSLRQGEDGQVVVERWS